MAVVPRFRSTVKADFSVERVKFLRRPENKHLALHWNEYLEDLLAICRPPSARVISPLSMGEFLRRHQELVVSRVVFWHGAVGREEVLRVLSYLRFVSGPRHRDSRRRRRARLPRDLIALGAASRFVDKMYGLPRATRPTPHPRPRLNGRGGGRRAACAHRGESPPRGGALPARVRGATRPRKDHWRTRARGLHEAIDPISRSPSPASQQASRACTSAHPHRRRQVDFGPLRRGHHVSPRRGGCSPIPGRRGTSNGSGSTSSSWIMPDTSILHDPASSTSDSG